MNAIPFCTGLLDEARVTVDTSLLERAAAQSPSLAIALLLSLLGLGFALGAAPRGHGWWSLFTLLAPVVALAASFLFELRTELHFACVSGPAKTSLKFISVSAGIATFAFIQLGITSSLRAWKREVQVVWPAVLLGTALGLCDGVVEGLGFSGVRDGAGADGVAAGPAFVVVLWTVCRCHGKTCTTPQALRPRRGRR